MKQGMFRYKVYRKKLLATILVVVVLSLLILGSTTAFLLDGWAKKQQSAALIEAAKAEDRLSYAESQINEYLVGLYSSDALITDLLSLLDSSDESAYLRSRLENSTANSSEIASFPADLENRLLRRSSYVRGVEITSSSSHAVLYLDEKGEMQIRFFSEEQQVPGTDAFDKELSVVRLLYNPNRITVRIGALRFWLNSDMLDCRGGEFSGVLSTSIREESYRMCGSQPHAAQWLAEIGGAREAGGVFFDGADPVFYWHMPSSHAGMEITAAVNGKTLLAENASTCWFLLAVFALAMTVVIVFLMTGMAMDAKFLGSILDTIGQVEKGNFKTREMLPVRRRPERADEYRMIADALDNMSVVLGDYIHNEYQLKLKQQETAMRALQHQINPHFLYNTLEAIRAQALIAGDGGTADAIALLGGLYRDTVRCEDVIPLRLELSLLEDYLKLMQLRYPGLFCYQIEAEEGIETLSTVKFWMQPLAENFFKHGFDRESEYNLLLLRLWRENGRVCIEMSDNGRGVALEKLEAINSTLGHGDDGKTSIGLRNVYSRLRFYYGKSFSMHIGNNPEGGASIQIGFEPKEG